MSEKRLSIVVITWNESGVLRRCLNSLYESFDFVKDEVVVVDNGSVDDTVEMCRRSYPNVRMLELPNNIGVGPARNRGMMYSKGEYIMTLDNDTLVSNVADLGDIVEDNFRKFEIGVMGFVLLNRDYSFQQSCRRFPGWFQPLAARFGPLKRLSYFREIQAAHLMEDVDFKSVQFPLEVDYIIGANQVFRRKLFARLGGYDEKIFFGPEDFEFCWRVRQLGLKNYLFDNFKIVHDYQRRTRRFGLMMIKHILAYYYVMMKIKLQNVRAALVNSCNER